MESKDQSELDVSSTAETPRKWWKSPLQWPRTAVAWFALIPRALSYLKGCPAWPRLIFSWAKANKLTALLVLSSAIAILLPLWLSVSAWNVWRQRALGAPVKIEQIYSSLERGDYAETKTLAKRLMDRDGLPKEEAGVAPFALGAVAVFEAEKLTGINRQLQYLLASRYLEQASAQGFPEAHRAEGLYLYGKSLYEIGHFAKCRTVLLEAMKIAPRHKAEIYSLLANAFLNEAKLKLAQAMEQNALYLADKKLSPADRQQGLLQKARIQLRMDKLDECRSTLKQIPENAKDYASAMVVAGQAVMRESQLLRGKTAEVSEGKQLQAREKYEEAIKTLRLAEGRAAMGSEPMRQAMYLIGVGFMEMADDRAANDQFTRTHKLFSETPEGIAAYLQKADLSRRAGREMEMLSEYRRVLGGLDKSIPYFNSWVMPEELKSRLTNTYQQYQGKQQFEVCLQLIGLMKPLVPAEESRLMQADLYAKWGQYLLNNAEKVAQNKREPLQRLAREQFRRAGQNYAALAKMFADTRQYTDQIWNAATAYLQGHNYQRAASLFRDYLKNEVQRRHPQALDYLGESLLSMGQYDAALDTLKECIELFPRDVAACHARILASQAYREKGDIQEAEKALLANLNGDYLTPASKEWRDSLYLLGELLHGAGRYAEAARRLEETAKRYPDHSETIQARYLLADSYGRLAFAMQDDLKKDLSGSSRVTQLKQIHEDFEKALTQYRTIQEKLNGSRDWAEMTPLEISMLRNAYFSIGDILYAEGEYHAAIEAYLAAISRYQNRPEAINAYVQISNAYRRLEKPEEAHNILQQAKLFLSRMKPEVSFAETSIYSRKQWSDRLDQLSQL